MNSNVSAFLEDRFAAHELNRLPSSYGGGRIFDKPLIGVSGGDDPIFEKFKEVVAPEHLTPMDMWTQSGMIVSEPSASHLRIMSIIFPYVDDIREQSKTATKIPAEIYAVGRNFANPFMKDVIQETIRFFEDEGFQAMAGMYSKVFKVIITTDPVRRYSVWSERHIAFAAGLGTFSLHEGFITDVGCNIRISSIITDAPLDITPRLKDDPYGNCLYYAQGTCKECVDRCPGDALSEEGHDKEKCRNYVQAIQEVLQKRLGSTLKPTTRRFQAGEKIAYPTGCAFCQFDVPCMDKNPVAS